VCASLLIIALFKLLIALTVSTSKAVKKISTGKYPLQSTLGHKSPFKKEDIH
jgi:hypothetical protein